MFFIGGWKTEAKDCRGINRKKSVPPFLNKSRGDETCNGRIWPKSCGPDMPGPSNDTCGPADAAYSGNSGCGISMATSKQLDGPWDVAPLKITDQWRSDEVYC